MCTRILNSLNPNFPITARNMDWSRPINVYLYQFPKGETKFGLSIQERDELTNEQASLEWTSTYSSVASVMGDDHIGLGSADGMNSEGLVVNALFDSDSSFADETLHQQDSTPRLSVLRWAQFTLDCFANVNCALEYYRNNNFLLISGVVPDGAETAREAQLHLSLSDSAGNSAILEIREGKLVIHSDSTYRVVTNQPDYDTQLKLDYYWQYMWGKTEPKIKTPVNLAPGGVTSTQNFERASYYLAMTDSAASEDEALAQTRTMLGTCTTPVGFNSHHSEHGTSTRWSNLANSVNKTYYFINQLTLSPVWLTIHKNIEDCKRVELVQVIDNKVKNWSLAGDLEGELVNSEDPLAH